MFNFNIPPLKFPSFKEAFDYQKYCPLCNDQMKINDRDLADGLGSFNQKLSFSVDQIGYETVTVDTETGNVEVSNSSKAYLLHVLHIDCNKCCQYGYHLRIHFDLAVPKLDGIYLGGEKLSFEEGGMVHEIYNSYSVEKTYYSYFDREGDSRKTCLPIVPLNLSNPKDTINRIRKLLIFA